MRKKTLEIKPTHLVILGMAIIILGVLVPSFFISAYSTIVFAIIIGAVILLSAYAFFAVNLVKSKGKKTIKWLLLPVIVALLVAGGFFAHFQYQRYQNNKIYTINEDIKFSDFTLTLYAPTYIVPPLIVPKEKIAAFGDINTLENCAQYKFLNTQPSFDFNDKSTWRINENDWEKNHPSGKYCEWRNDSRNKIQAYLADNKRVQINYKITAEDAVESEDIQVTIMLDSGRDVKKPVSLFEYDALLSTNYTPAFDYKYEPYSSTQLGDNINKGVTRSQSITFDINNSEKIIDIKVKFKGQIRLIRIMR